MDSIEELQTFEMDGAEDENVPEIKVYRTGCNDTNLRRGVIVGITLSVAVLIVTFVLAIVDKDRFMVPVVGLGISGAVGIIFTIVVSKMCKKRRIIRINDYDELYLFMDVSRCANPCWL
jgi:hypothetical protein